MAVIQEVATTFLREKLEQLGDTGDNEKVALLMTLEVLEFMTKLFEVKTAYRGSIKTTFA